MSSITVVRVRGAGVTDVISVEVAACGSAVIVVEIVGEVIVEFGFSGGFCAQDDNASGTMRMNM